MMARTVAEDLELPLEKLGFYDLPYARHHFPNSWNPTGGKEVHVRFLQKKVAQTTFFLWLTFMQFQFLTSISFGLRHHCLSTGLHCSTAKWNYRFLMKMNYLIIFFFAFL